MAKDALMIAQDRQSQYANKHHCHHTYNLGDKVMLNAQNINNPVDKSRSTRKLSPKYLGPFTITHIISTTTYKLDLPNTLKVHPVFHISMLKPYHETPDEFEHITPLPPITIPETNKKEYEVENILDKRLFRGKPQYLVKWKGYPLHDATWEPLKHLDNAKKTINEFELTRTSKS